MTKARLNTERMEELFKVEDDRGFEAFAPKEEEATMTKAPAKKQQETTHTRGRDFYARRAALVEELNHKIDLKGSELPRALWVKALTKELGVHAHPSLLALYVPFSHGFSGFGVKWSLMSSNSHKIILFARVKDKETLRLVINKADLRAVLWLGQEDDNMSWEKVDSFKGGGSA